jgi:phospholipid/cholesterol/gamma-HCH transport system substrate-binding protein
MLLAAIGLLGFFVLWVQNFRVRGRSFQATILFPNAGRMSPGTNVTYRGVSVGRVESIVAEAEGVVVGIEISPADRLIPANSRIEVVQAGLVGESSIDITPLQSLPLEGVKAKPLDPDCDPTVIICQGSQLEGEGALDVNSLIRSLLKISSILSDPRMTTAISSIFQKADSSLGELSLLLRDVRQSDGIENVNATLRSLNLAAADVASLLAQVKQSGSVDTLNSTLASLDDAAKEIKVFMAANQSKLALTLDSIGQTSEQLQVTVKDLDPILKQVEGGQLVRNLDTTFANVAELTANFRDLSKDINEPTNILMLQQILDSARSTFQNLNKITSDLDELTGNPELRKDLEKLIKGLSDLTSSTQQLQQQVEYGRALNRLALETGALNSQGDRPSTPGKQPVSNFSSTPTQPED